MNQQGSSTAWLSSLAPYLVPIAAVAAALLIREGIYALMGDGVETHFLLLLGAVMASALYGGVGPGALATLLAVCSVYFLYMKDWVVVYSPAQFLEAALFVLEGALVSALGGRLRAVNRR